MTIQVPNKFLRMAEENFVDVLSLALRKEMGEGSCLEYQTWWTTTTRQQVRPLPHRYPESEEVSSEEITNPFVIPGIKNQDWSPTQWAIYFRQFCGRWMQQAGQGRSGNNSRQTRYYFLQSLVIFGDTGLGKTHLSQAIGNAITKNSTTNRSSILLRKGSPIRWSRAIRNNSINDFMNHYQMIDVLIVDDIWAFANRPKTQGNLFNIFNQLHQSGKQIIPTSDRAPKDLQDVEKRLISCFKWASRQIWEHRNTRRG